MMNPPRFYTDEGAYKSVAEALRRAGFDAISTPEVNRLGTDDDSQLEWAASQRRTLVTFNVAHFVRLHATWITQGRAHAGIVVSSQHPVGDTIRRLSRLAAAHDASRLQNALEFLGNW